MSLQPKAGGGRHAMNHGLYALKKATPAAWAFGEPSDGQTKLSPSP